MSLIDASAIPGADIDLAAVRSGALGLVRSGGVVRDRGADIVRDWQRLPGVFEATGTESLYAAMVPVGTTTSAIGDSLVGIARALTAYAAEMEPIKARLDALRSQAVAFAAKAKSFHPHMEWVSSGYTLGVPLPEKIDHWYEDPDLNDTNNSLIREVSAAEADWLDAQQRCATAIRAAVGLAATGAADERALAAQLRSGDAMQTPWGTTGDRKESCSEKAVTFQSHFLWDGVIVGFGWGTIKTLDTLVGMNPDSVWKAADGVLHGDWAQVAEAGREDLQALGQAWLGVAHLVSALAIPIPPAVRMSLLHSGALDWLPQDVKQGAEDWTAADGTAFYGTVAGLVGLTLPTKWWDPKAYKADEVFRNWTENPGGAAGTSVANIGSFFIPGVGEARAGGIIADAGRVAEGTRVADMIADGSIHSLRGLSADALKATIKGLSDADAVRLAHELAKPELDAGALSALKLDDLRVHGQVEIHGPEAAHEPGAVHEPTAVHEPGVHEPVPSEGERASSEGHEPPAAHPAEGVHDAPTITHPELRGPTDSYGSGDPAHPGLPAHSPITVGDHAGGPGEWVERHRSGGAWADYQAQISGTDRLGSGGLHEYKVEGPSRSVDFDGFALRGDPPHQVYLDAKYGYWVPFKPDASAIIQNGQLAKLAAQAERQLSVVPVDAVVEWHFSNPVAAEHVRDFFEEQRIPVHVYYTPKAR